MENLLFLKNPSQYLLFTLTAVISTNESTRFITGHVIYNLTYTYKFQLKTTPVTASTKQRRNNSRVLNDPKDNFGTATNINDNVGVTVIMPPGK